MNSFSNKFRSINLDKASSEIFDIVVIGGGITGAGIAFDASSRGLSIALLEKNDFASGTSSKSTKLIHGGLRYLQNFQFNQVRITAQERKILFKNVAHLVKPQDIVIPVYRNNKVSMLDLSVGLRLYELLGSVKKEDRHKKLNREDLIELIPEIKTTDLLGGYVYKEYKTDDARLVIQTLKEAHKNSAQIFNYLECIGISKEKDIFHLTCRDKLNKQDVVIKSKVVVNASGPWVDDVRNMETKESESKLILSKGVHIVFRNSDFPLSTAVYFENNDGRLIFCIPDSKHVYVGTTDTFYSEGKDNIETTTEDIDYLLNAVNKAFPKVNLSSKQLCSNWAGVRPLIHEEGKSPSEISRKDEIFISQKGMISIAGGKLTGFRKMAENVVDLVFKRFFKSRRFVKSRTREMPYTSSVYDNNFLAQVVKDESNIAYPGLEELFEKYGSDLTEIIKICRRGHSITDAEILYTIDNEMIALPSDFLMRRTQYLHYKEFDENLNWDRCLTILENEGLQFKEASERDFKGFRKILESIRNLKQKYSD